MPPRWVLIRYFTIEEQSGFARCSGVLDNIVWAANHIPWWRHQMETFSALLAICAGNSAASGEFPVQRPVTRSFDVFFALRWINGWVNNREAGDLRRYRAHYDGIIMRYGQRAMKEHLAKNVLFKIKLFNINKYISIWLLCLIHMFKFDSYENHLWTIRCR